MKEDNSLEALAFSLKLLGTTEKRVLVSAGKHADKHKMLKALKALATCHISIYATPGTSRFLTEHGIENTYLHKIADKEEPNVLSHFKKSSFDLVINILTGNNDYDESSDSNLIRALCIENGVPLYTDISVAIMIIEDMLRKQKTGYYGYRIADPKEPWNLKKEFLQLVAEKGGFACYHAHFDKAYLISLSNLRLSRVDMQKKWDLYRHLKSSYTIEDLYERISRCMENMLRQGVTHCRSFIDADTTIGLKAINVANDVRKAYEDRMKIEFAVQPLEGVVDKDARDQFAAACERADVIGGLPSRDRPTPEKHLDIIMSIAKDLGKPVDVHVDQENNPDENETELLALKTVEHGLEGRVRAVHAISVAAKPISEQDRVLDIAKDAGLSFVICPSAALSMKQLSKKVAPLHNSIAPLAKLIDKDLPVYLGVDNIYDLFMPFVDGDMWVECRVLMEAARYYDIDTIAGIACDKTGFTRGLSQSSPS